MSKKYNRTYHFSFSEGATSDDKIQFDISNLLNNEIVITEKLDGSNSCITNKGPFGRSHAEITRNPWDIKLHELYNQIGNDITNELYLFGESMYAIHSIEYKKLDSHFYLFGIRDNDIWLSWKEVEEYAYLLNLKTVPVLFKGVIKSETELKDLVKKFMSEGSKLGGDIEGIVIRRADDFHDSVFSLNLQKFVRQSHVKTDKHWQRNWLKADIKYER